MCSWAARVDVRARNERGGGEARWVARVDVRARNERGGGEARWVARVDVRARNERGGGEAWWVARRRSSTRILTRSTHRSSSATTHACADVRSSSGAVSSW